MTVDPVPSSGTSSLSETCQFSCSFVFHQIGGIDYSRVGPDLAAVPEVLTTDKRGGYLRRPHTKRREERFRQRTQ
jgi:hypothetical protein